MTKLIEPITLLAATDIPFYPLATSIHQPTIKELSFMGEKGFWTACEILTFSKNKLMEKDKSSLEKLTDFEIIMTMVNGPDVIPTTNRTYLTMLLSLLFPDYSIAVSKRSILLEKEGEQKREINNSNFENFRGIIKEIFCLTSKEEENYNPAGDIAAQIAKKFEERKRKLQEVKSTEGEQFISIFARYISILAVGEHKDINSLMNYSVYQLLNEFNRYRLKLAYDIYLQLACAGGKPKDEPEDWMKEID